MKIHEPAFLRNASLGRKTCNIQPRIPLGMQPKNTTVNKIELWQTQEHHHKKKTFVEEYKKILKDVDLEYDERYIFKPIED